MKRVLLLGGTGSIGKSTLNIFESEKQKFLLCGISANSNQDVKNLAQKFSCPYSLFCEEGIDGIERLIEKSKPDIIVNGISGAAGLLPSVIALKNKIPLALANKETLVMAGKIVLKIAKKNKVQIIPVDSEHSAIFSLLKKCGKKNVSKIILTASGGPFRTWSAKKIKGAKLSDALKHPTWNMGAKITVDSATLANKGLEVIEAARLFDLPSEKIQVVIHPESIVHSLVQTNDKILYAQMSSPDMRHPILSALNFPECENDFLEPFSLFGKTLTFSEPRWNDFPLLKIAFDVSESEAHSIVFNAANEIAVKKFLQNQISFLQIAKITQKTLERDWNVRVNCVEDVFEIDDAARKIAEEFL